MTSPRGAGRGHRTLLAAACALAACALAAAPPGCRMERGKLVSCAGYGGATLDLSGYGITEVAPRAFEGLRGLRELHCGYNAIAGLPEGVFDGLVGLRALRLPATGLRAVPAGAFDDLVALRVLVVSVGALGALPPGIFDALGELEVLDLSFNELGELPTGVFAKLGRLQRLWLQGNRLSAVPDISGMPRLVELFLFDNPLPDALCKRSAVCAACPAGYEAPISTDASGAALCLPSPYGPAVPASVDVVARAAEDSAVAGRGCQPGTHAVEAVGGAPAGCRECGPGTSCTGQRAPPAPCECAPGHHSPAIASASCVDTAATCAPCGAGYACAGGPAQRAECTCAPGRYSKADASPACAGAGGSCRPCPAGAACEGGGSSPVACTCAAHHYSAVTGSAGCGGATGTCEACPPGHVCRGGAAPPLACPVGTYNSAAGVCTACRAGTHGERAGAVACAPCPLPAMCLEGNVCGPGASGGGGRACSVCDEGHHEVYGRCRVCPARRARWGALAVAAVLLAAVCEVGGVRETAARLVMQAVFTLQALLLQLSYDVAWAPLVVVPVRALGGLLGFAGLDSLDCDGGDGGGRWSVFESVAGVYAVAAVGAAAAAAADGGWCGGARCGSGGACRRSGSGGVAGWLRPRASAWAIAARLGALLLVPALQLCGAALRCVTLPGGPARGLASDLGTLCSMSDPAYAALALLSIQFVVLLLLLAPLCLYREGGPLAGELAAPYVAGAELYEYRRGWLRAVHVALTTVPYGLPHALGGAQGAVSVAVGAVHLTALVCAPPFRPVAVAIAGHTLPHVLYRAERAAAVFGCAVSGAALLLVWAPSLSAPVTAVVLCVGSSLVGALLLLAAAAAAAGDAGGGGAMGAGSDKRHEDAEAPGAVDGGASAPVAPHASGGGGSSWMRRQGGGSTRRALIVAGCIVVCVLATLQLYAMVKYSAVATGAPSARALDVRPAGGAAAAPPGSYGDVYEATPGSADVDDDARAVSEAAAGLEAGGRGGRAAAGARALQQQPQPQPQPLGGGGAPPPPPATTSNRNILADGSNAALLEKPVVHARAIPDRRLKGYREAPGADLDIVILPSALVLWRRANPGLAPLLPLFDACGFHDCGHSALGGSGSSVDIVAPAVHDLPRWRASWKELIATEYEFKSFDSLESMPLPEGPGDVQRALARHVWSETAPASVAVLNEACVSGIGHIFVDGLAFSPLRGCEHSTVPQRYYDAAVWYDEAVSVGQMWSESYYHGFIESLGRLALVAPYVRANPRVKVLVTSKTDAPFTLGLLALMGIGEERVSNAACAHRLLVPEPAACGRPSPRHLLALQSEMHRALAVNTSAPPAFDILLVHRPKRPLANFWDLYGGLCGVGRVALFHDLLPLRDGLALWAGARLVVASHGAGLANMVASSRPFTVIEFVTPRILSRTYERMALLLGYRYVGFFPPDSTLDLSGTVDVAAAVAEVRGALPDARGPGADRCAVEVQRARAMLEGTQFPPQF